MSRPGLADDQPAQWPHTLAVAGDVYHADDRVRRGVLETVQRRTTEVILWGSPVADDSTGQQGLVQHRLSAAARVFKAHALAVTLSAPAEVGPVETFHRPAC